MAQGASPERETEMWIWRSEGSFATRHSQLKIQNCLSLSCRGNRPREPAGGGGFVRLAARLPKCAFWAGFFAIRGFHVPTAHEENVS